MFFRPLSSVVTALGIAAALMAGLAPASAQDFFSRLFGGFGFPPPPMMAPPDAGAPPPAPRRTSQAGAGQAFCVRTCDGRYFPLSSGRGETKAAACQHLCPAAETKVFYGAAIADAASSDGERYTRLPNAFRYRNELVGGCSCNGGVGGLAHIDVNDDPTIRKGDIVVGHDGLMVAGRSADRHAATLNFSPAPPALSARLAHAVGAPAAAAD